MMVSGSPQPPRHCPGGVGQLLAPFQRRAQGELAAQRGQEERPFASVVIAQGIECGLQHRHLVGVDDPDRTEEAAAVP